MEEKNGTTVRPWAVFIWTNHCQSFWKTPSPCSPCSARMAFRRDLVVLDCHPPSNRRMKLSPISAIRLPWSRTCATSSVWVTLVLALCQSVPLEMASFMSRSILRMFGCCAVDFLRIQRIGGQVKRGVPVRHLPQHRRTHTHKPEPSGSDHRQGSRARSSYRRRRSSPARSLRSYRRGTCRSPSRIRRCPRSPRRRVGRRRSEGRSWSLLWFVINHKGVCFDQISRLVQYLSCHTADGFDRFPQQIEQTSGNDQLKHGATMVGWGSGFGKGRDHRSHSISSISAASMAGSSQRTPSPVSPMNRPTTPSVMQRTNFCQGVSVTSQNSTHALAVL